MLGAGDEELLVEGVSDLLPQNTQVFPSTPRAGCAFYVIVWLGGALSILLGLAALARAHDLALYGAAGGCGVAVLAAAFALHRCTAARHAAAVRAGERAEAAAGRPAAAGAPKANSSERDGIEEQLGVSVSRQRLVCDEDALEAEEVWSTYASVRDWATIQLTNLVQEFDASSDREALMVLYLSCGGVWWAKTQSQLTV